MTYPFKIETNATLWIGKKDGEWPLYAFASEELAAIWLTERDEENLRNRRIWKVLLREADEYVLSPPVKPTLVRRRKSDW